MGFRWVTYFEGENVRDWMKGCWLGGVGVAIMWGLKNLQG